MNEQEKDDFLELCDAYDREPTFFQWMVDNLDADDVVMLREHGAKAGIPGLTNASDAADLYDRFSDIEDVALSRRYLLTRRVESITDVDQLKTAMVWAVAEHYADNSDLLRLIQMRSEGDEGGQA